MKFSPLPKSSTEDRKESFSFWAAIMILASIVVIPMLFSTAQIQEDNATPPKSEPLPSPQIPLITPGNSQTLPKSKPFHSKPRKKASPSTTPGKVGSVANFPITFDDIIKVAGKPYRYDRNSMEFWGGESQMFKEPLLKVTKTPSGIDVEFPALNTYGQLYAAAFFNGPLFTPTEQKGITDFIGKLNQSKRIGRFQVKITSSTIPKWLCVSLTTPQ